MVDMINGQNPNDPLTKHRQPTEREIFAILSQACTGLTVDQVMEVSANLIINAIRQSHSLRGSAEAQMSELFGKSMQALLQHYDSVTGKRLNVFPFTQHVHAAPVVVDENKH